MIEVGTSGIDHAKRRKVGMEGLSVQFAHSLHHLGFVFAPHLT